MIYINTLQELLDNNINLHNANNMINSYKAKINTYNGVYIITDINYDFNIGGRVVTLKCSKCGKIIRRTLIKNRNKWSELIKKCSCEKIEKQNELKAEFEKSEKIKKDTIMSRIGDVYGDYKITDVEYTNNTPRYIMECTKCGNVEKIFAGRKSFKGKAFHCTRHYVRPIKFDNSYIGRKNNMLKVTDIVRDNKHNKKFLCLCDCGKYKMVEPVFWEKGVVKSCGCLAKSSKITHSQELDRLRSIYNGMMQRCYNPKSASYKYYGGRGIKICEEWHDRENFINWALENGYQNNLSIDRIDVNGNYEPSNCRWADWITQANNRRPKSEFKKREHKTWTIDNLTKTREEWCKEYDIGLPAVLYRIKHKDLSVEEALKTPKETQGRPRKKAI